MIKVYGPYTRKDGRQHVVLVHKDSRKQTMSYPKYLMEQYLKRPLLDTETVDHINNDFTDNRIENLQILTRSENAAKEMQRTERAKKFYEFTCPICGTFAIKPLNFVKGNKNKGRAGPFCSRKCAGIASSPST